MMVQLEADGENISKSKKRKSSEEDDSQSHAGPKTKKKVHKTRSKTKAPKKSKASGPATRTTARQKRENQRQIQSVASLFSSNVFKDQAGENAAQQPTFKSTKKADALKELIASVHPDNKKVANDDVKVLLAATKDFDGRGSVKADGHGLWLVKGMKTSLKPYQVLGAAFMRRRERSLDEPRGGLLADQMGLGVCSIILKDRLYYC